MKKIFVFLLLVSAIVAQAQTLDKGSISFRFSGIGINSSGVTKAPFTSVSLRKEDHFYVSARAEINKDSWPLIINMELELYKIWNATIQDSRTRDSLISLKQDIPFTLANRIDMQQFEINTNVYSFLMLKDNGNSVGKFENLERRNLGIGDFTYASQKVVCKVTDTNIKLENKKYIIQGKFIIMVLSDNPSIGTSLISEIKDGVFEIII